MWDPHCAAVADAKRELSASSLREKEKAGGERAWACVMRGVMIVHWTRESWFSLFSGFTHHPSYLLIAPSLSSIFFSFFFSHLFFSNELASRLLLVTSNVCACLQQILCARFAWLCGKLCRIVVVILKIDWVKTTPYFFKRWRGFY